MISEHQSGTPSLADKANFQNKINQLLYLDVTRTLMNYRNKNHDKQQRTKL